jgi:hypothetical protein
MENIHPSEAHDQSDASKSKSNPVLEVLSKYQDVKVFSPNERPVRLAPTITIDNKRVGSPGNIMAIIGQPKSGKSSGSLSIVSGAINPTMGVDVLGMTIKHNSEGHAVFYFDTEQSHEDFDERVESVMNRIGLKREEKPECFYSVNCRSSSIAKNKDLILDVLEVAHKHHGGIHLITIDGLGDFVSSVNDEKECNDIVDFFLTLAQKYNTLVVVILHQNPKSDKTRGHLGSQLERKAESVLEIKKREDAHSITAKLLRNADAFKPIYFRYDEELGYPVIDHLMEMGKEQAQKIEDKKMLNIFFKEDVEVEKKVMCERYAKVTGNNSKSAYPIIAGLVQRSIIRMKEGSKLYVKVEL